MPDCASCGSRLVPGSLFCDKCGATQSTVKVTRKLRQSSFSNIKDASGGILSPGERLKSGRQSYVIEEAIARSGFGATFRALRTKDDKQCLIKQWLEQSAYDQVKKQLMTSFVREAKFLRKIKHPAFPRGFDYFEKNGSIYLVMEFINGKDLAKAVDDYRKTHGSIPDGLLVYVGREIAEALEVIHTYGYVYRDLKPQNVMLDGISSRVKLIDFGTLYRASDSDPLIFESEGYTPPEFKQKDYRFSAAGDVYSLGALLFEMAEGQTPKVDDKTLSKGGKRDKRLCVIIEKCLLSDPGSRFQRSRNVFDELSKLTRKGFWPFRNKNAISPVELSVLPKTLYPSSCTFCDFCGFADPHSQAGYCKNCRVPLRVGRVAWKEKDQEREFFLYADETIIGKAAECHFSVKELKNGQTASPQHARIFRRKTGLWLESLEKTKDNTIVNQRKVLGPVELLDGDTISFSEVSLKFSLRDAC